MRILSIIEIDMLLTLYHLRYLTTDQIHKYWYSDRTLENCLCRLSRLNADKLITRVNTAHRRWRFAWRTGDNALAYLMDQLKINLVPYESLKAQFLPHLIETNDVFLKLRGTQKSWQQLPFQWLGSHHCGLPFIEVRQDKRRNRILRPDAIITSSNHTPRIFLELDRSTESIVSTTGRNSIESKLRRYRVFFTAFAHQDKTWYQHKFNDLRPPLIIFIVPPSPRQSRRKQSIDTLIKQADHKIQPHVYCFTADKVSSLSQILKLGNLPIQMPSIAEESISFSVQELDDLKEFYRISCEAYQRLHPESSVRPKFQRLAPLIQQALRSKSSNQNSSGEKITAHQRISALDALKHNLTA